MNSNSELVKTLLKRRATHPVEVTEIFSRHGVAQSDGVSSLVETVRRDGANSFMTYVARGGEGVDYEKIVRDVGRTLGASFVGGASQSAVEISIVHCVIDKMRDADRRLFEAVRDRSHGVRHSANIRTAGMGVSAAALFVVRRQVTNQILKQLGKQTASRLPGTFIPGLNVLLALWTINDVAGPAYRKTIPTVIDIAFMRYEAGEI